MSKSVTFLFFSLLIYSCKPYIQLVEVTSNQLIPNEQKELVFENDTLRIRYDFFSENGEIKFSVLNKLQKPLYINWKESAFITSTNFFPYWQEKYIANGNIYSASVDSSRNISSFGTKNYSVVERNEQTTFIPPGAELHQFKFMAKTSGEFDGVLKGNREDIKSGVSKKLVGIKFRFNENETPLRFRNYLTFSTDAEHKSTFELDTHFWVSEVYKTDGRYLFGTKYQGHYSLNEITRSKKFRDQIGANHFFVRAQLYTIEKKQGAHRKMDTPKEISKPSQD